MFTLQRILAVVGLIMALFGLSGSVRFQPVRRLAFALGLMQGGIERVAGYPGNLWVLYFGVVALGATGVAHHSPRVLPHAVKA